MNRPQTFGSYELLERINLGGMAEVFRAHDVAHQREVAIKRILPTVAEDEEFIQAFRNEVTLASQLIHPNIAQIYDVGRVDRSFYLALEFIDGKDLRIVFEDAQKRAQPLPLDFILQVVVEVALGLEYAHGAKDARGKSLGIVHRDVSPENILISFGGDVKIIDFGIARATGKLSQTQVGKVKGKFGYMSPEQVRGLPVDQRSDVFSLGVCLWELLALQRLFAGENETATMDKIFAGDVPPLSEIAPYVPIRLEHIVLKALAKDADERYGSAAELQAELIEFARAQNLVLDRSRAAEYMQRVFAVERAHNRPIEEKSVMSEKSSSDLDVFEGLSKKGEPAADEAPTPFLPPVSSSYRAAPVPFGRSTLVGMPLVGAQVSRSAPAAVPPAGPAPADSNAVAASFPSSPMPAAPPAGAQAGVGTLLGIAPTGLSAFGAMPASSPASEGDEKTAVLGSSEPVAAAPARPRVDVDMDWDEEDEKTSVFEKPEATTVYERPEGTFPLGGPSPFSGGYASPPGSSLPPPNSPPNPSTRTMSGIGFGPVPPPAGRTGRYSSVPSSSGRLPAAAPIATASLAPPSLAPPPFSLGQSGLITGPGARPPRRNLYVIAGIGAVLLIGLSLFAASRRSGKVAVFTSSTSGRPLSKLAIYVDGVQKCSVSPCTLDLDKGIHALKASADGYAPQEQGATVNAGEELAVNFKLERASLGTGIKVATRQEGIDLFIDGREIGPLPQEVKDLSPGRHTISLRGSDRYAPEERTLNVESDEVKDLGTVTLKVVRGLASFDVRTPGVKVTLVSGKDRRQLTDFSQPVEIEASKVWTIEATKPGFDDFRQPITFEDRAEKKFLIVLQERTQPAPPPAPVAAPAAPAYARPAPQPAPEARAAAEPSDNNESSSDAPQPVKATPSGTCTLNFNTIPVSNVVLDGRPIGGTPKLGVSASVGSHTVMFVGPDDARKATSVTCKPGEVKTVSFRLSQP